MFQQELVDVEVAGRLRGLGEVGVSRALESGAESGQPTASPAAMGWARVLTHFGVTITGSCSTA